MPFDVGIIVKGKISKITGFGAFVELESGEAGMIHISEISDCYVKQIKDFLEEGQVVQARVIGTLKNGNVSLSLKGLKKDVPEKDRILPSFKNKEFKKNNSNSSPTNFEDMLFKFKKISEDKISDFRKSTVPKSSGLKRGKRR